MSATHQIIKPWFPAFLWLLFIILASSDMMAGEQTSRIIGPLLRWLVPGISDQTVSSIHFGVRKMAHVVEYAILATLIWRGLRRTMRISPASVAILTIAACALCAVFDEWRQSRTQARFGAWQDVVLDCAGAVLAVSILLWASRRKRIAEATSSNGAS